MRFRTTAGYLLLPQGLLQSRNRSERSLEVRAFAINHVALERCITPGKSSISHKAGNGPQGLGDRICAVSGELMAISCGICQYDLSCQERNFSEIIVPAKHVQIIYMADECRVARAASVGEPGACPPG